MKVKYFGKEIEFDEIEGRDEFDVNKDESFDTKEINVNEIKKKISESKNE